MVHRRTHVSLFFTLENLFVYFFFDFLSATILYFFLYPLKVSLLSTTNNIYSPTSKINATPARIHFAGGSFVFNCASNTHVGPLNIVL